MQRGYRYAVIGAGMQGEQIASDLLRSSGTAQVLILDYDQRKVSDLRDRLNDPRVIAKEIDGRDRAAVSRAIKDYDVFILAADYELNEELTKAGIDAKVNVTDLGGSNIIVAKQFALDRRAKEAGIVVIPDQGFCPGLNGIVAEYGYHRRGIPRYEYSMAAGLPQEPKGPLEYMIVFAPKGLVNEYIMKSRILKDFKIYEAPGLSGRGTITFRHPDLKEPMILEKARTSGGTSTRPDSYEGIVQSLECSTGRPPGHYDMIDSMIAASLFSENPFKTETQSRKEIVTKLIENAELDDNQLANLAEMGFFDEVGIGSGTRTPRDIAEDVIKECCTYDGLDMGLLQVVIGTDEWKAEYSLMHKQEEGGPTSMAVLTGWSQSISAQMIAKGQLKRWADDKVHNGVLRTEFAIIPELYVNELEERGLKVHEEFRLKAA